MIYYSGNSYSGGFNPSLTRTVKTLIIINVVVFILMHLVSNVPWLLFFGLIPRLVFRNFMIWQLVTYMFLHVGLWHLVVNMLMLWFFGPAIEVAWGRKRFLSYYLFTGMGAALCSFVTAFNSPVPVIGASGAIFGILVAYAMMFPESIILLFFFFPMKIRYAVMVLAAINLLGALSSPGNGIAYFAHLGGGLFGYLYLRSEWIRFHMHNFVPSILRRWKSVHNTQRRQSVKKDLNRRVDHILDKISKEGIDSLTREEKGILEEKSKQR